MPSSDHLSSKLNLAIQNGRAISLLVDYRPPELPDHTFTVYGLIDGRDFEGTFVPDDYDGEELVHMPLPRYHDSVVPELKLDSEDAMAVHELWSLWNGGVRQDYLLFVKVLAQLLSQAKLLDALQAVSTRNVPAKKKKARKANATE